MRKDASAPPREPDATASVVIPAPEADRSFRESLKETFTSAGGRSLQERDADAQVNAGDRLMYLGENAIVTYPSLQFWILLAFTFVLMIVLGGAWAAVGHTADGARDDFGTSVYTAFQVLSSGGRDPDVVLGAERAVFACMIFAGVIVFAILVGFITEAVTEFMTSLGEGHTKVVERGHT